MLQLTPLKETRAVQDLLRMEREQAEAVGEAKGEAKGEARGIRIGEILTLQRVLGRPQMSMEELNGMSLEALVALVGELERDLH